MKRNLLAIFFLVSFPTFACKLPSRSSLVIGCTYKCDIMYRMRLSLSALFLGYPIKIVDLRTRANVEDALLSVDGVLMPGGADINPEFYLDDVSPELKEYTQKNLHLVVLNDEGKARDPFEHELVQKYSSEDKYAKLPLLGICRGMQMMSVGQGIPLYLDIKTELGIKNRRYLFDTVNVQKNSLLDEIYLNDRVRGFKLHHQGIRVPYFKANRDKYPHVKVTAFSHNEKIAESIEYTHRLALGVQFHPEKSFTSTSAPIFKWFLTKSCEYKMAKGTP